jgi:hypothetical protein
MPRYFFNVIDGFDLPDNQGQELESAGNARRHALQVLSSLFAVLENDPSDHDWAVTVTDPRGLLLFTLEMQYTHSPATRPTPVRERAY